MGYDDFFLIGLVVAVLILSGVVGWLVYKLRENEKDDAQLRRVVLQREELYRKDQLAQALHREYLGGLIEKLSKEFDDSQMTIECRFNNLEDKED